MSGGGSLVHAIFREGVRTPFLWLQGYVPSPFYEREELEKRLILASKAPSEKIITFFRISNKFQDNGILKLKIAPSRDISKLSRDFEIQKISGCFITG